VSAALELALDAWRELNDRQRAYLEAVYRADPNEEAHERSTWSRGYERRPANEWRWIPYHSEFSQVRDKLLRLNLVDAGTGSTFDALARRGLILTRTSPIGTYQGLVDLLYLRLTTTGRKVARAGLGEKPPVRSPPGSVREWHWRALVKAYRAGDKGLRSEYGDDYASISYLTWRRLLEHRDGPLVREREVRIAAGPSENHILSVTETGRAFYEARWEEYRYRYPAIDAPRPSEPRRPAAGHASESVGPKPTHQ